MSKNKPWICLQVKLADYEKMSKFQKVVATDSEAVSNLEVKVGEMKKQLKAAEKEKKTEMNMQKMTFDSKVRLPTGWLIWSWTGLGMVRPDRG